MFARAQTFWNGLWSTACTKETWTQSHIIIGRRCFWFSLVLLMNIQVQLTSTFGGLILQGASMLVLSLCLSWHALEAFSGILAVLGTITWVCIVPQIRAVVICGQRLVTHTFNMVLNFFGRHWGDGGYYMRGEMINEYPSSVVDLVLQLCSGFSAGCFSCTCSPLTWMLSDRPVEEHGFYGAGMWWHSPSVLDLCQLFY